MIMGLPYIALGLDEGDVVDVGSAGRSGTESVLVVAVNVESRLDLRSPCSNSLSDLGSVATGREK